MKNRFTYCDTCEYRLTLGEADRYRCLLSNKMLKWFQPACEYYVEQKAQDAAEPKPMEYIWDEDRKAYVLQEIPSDDALILECYGTSRE